MRSLWLVIICIFLRAGSCPAAFHEPQDTLLTLDDAIACAVSGGITLRTVRLQERTSELGLLRENH